MKRDRTTFTSHSWRPGYTIPEKGPGSKPTIKQIAFVDHLLVHGNGTKAVIEAGYKTTNAAKMAVQLRAHPWVIKLIEERQTERRMKSELTVDYVIEKLMKLSEKNEDDNPQATLRALELMGKHLGMYKERQEISGPDGAAIETLQRTQEAATSFTNQLKQLQERQKNEESSRVPSSDERDGEGNVFEFPDRRAEGGT